MSKVFHIPFAKVSCLLALLMLSALPCVAGSIPPKPAEQSFIFDYAGMLDETAAGEMRGVAVAIRSACQAEVTVVTVKTLGDQSLEEYANELFNTWGIGDQKHDRGVLLLVNQEKVLTGSSGRIRIEVGYGLEGCLPDGKCGRILDTLALPAFAKRQYAKGIQDTFNAIARAVADEFKVDLSTAKELAPLADDQYQVSQVNTREWLSILFYIVIFLLYIGGRFTGFIPAGRGGGFRGGRSGGFGGFGGGRSGGGGASR